jgi:hypothetical protein
VYLLPIANQWRANVNIRTHIRRVDSSMHGISTKEIKTIIDIGILNNNRKNQNNLMIKSVKEHANQTRSSLK